MPTPNMGMTLPTDHGSSAVWGSLLNSALTNQVDAHDHSIGKGVQISQLGIALTGDLSFSSHALTNALALDLAPTNPSNVTGYAAALFADSTSNSGDLVYRSPGGTNVRITNGGSLNFSVTGGIGGDYTAVGALASFVDSSDSYVFQQQIGSAVRQYARMASADIDLYEYKAQPAAGVPTNRVRLASPAALGASYTVTWPGAVPGGTVGVQMSSAGVLSVSNTFASALVAPDFKNNADLIMQVDQAMAAPNANTRGTSAGEGQYKIVLSGGTGVNGLAVFPVPFLVGHKITAWTLYLKKLTDNTNTIAAQLHSWTPSTNSFVDQSAQTNSGNAPGFITLGQTGLALTIVAGTRYAVSVGMSAGAGTTDEVFFLEVNYQRP